MSLVARNLLCETFASVAQAAQYGPDWTKWPHLQWVGDLLRASVLCMDFNRVAEAWRRVSSVDGFDVREGNGRLKK